MSHIFALLQQMRGRLGMYLGTTSLTKLAAFLRGYDLACEQVGGRSTDPFLAEFRDWVHTRFQSVEHSWEETILYHSAGDEDAVQHFWKLLDEFLEENDRKVRFQGKKDEVIRLGRPPAAVPPQRRTGTG